MSKHLTARLPIRDFVEYSCSAQLDSFTSALCMHCTHIYFDSHKMMMLSGHSRRILKPPSSFRKNIFSRSGHSDLFKACPRKLLQALSILKVLMVTYVNSWDARAEVCGGLTSLAPRWSARAQAVLLLTVRQQARAWQGHEVLICCRNRRGLKIAYMLVHEASLSTTAVDTHSSADGLCQLNSACTIARVHR